MRLSLLGSGSCVLGFVGLVTHPTPWPTTQVTHNNHNDRRAKGPHVLQPVVWVQIPFLLLPGSVTHVPHLQNEDNYSAYLIQQCGDDKSSLRGAPEQCLAPSTLWLRCYPCSGVPGAPHTSCSFSHSRIHSSHAVGYLFCACCCSGHWGHSGDLTSFLGRETESYP